MVVSVQFTMMYHRTEPVKQVFTTEQVTALIYHQSFIMITRYHLPLFFYSVAINLPVLAISCHNLSRIQVFAMIYHDLPCFTIEQNTILCLFRLVGTSFTVEPKLWRRRSSLTTRLPRSPTVGSRAGVAENLGIPNLVFVGKKHHMN